MFKIGLILPLTEPFASTDMQLEFAARLYVAQHGDTVAGKKVVLIVKGMVHPARLHDDELIERSPFKPAQS